MKTLCKHIGYVEQMPVLFSTTIARNIQFGNINATQEEIETAAKQADIHEFIVSLPLGYETIVGERGTQFSGGQKQKIALARAFVKKPRILILDEASSALDTLSEIQIRKTIDKVSVYII